MRKRLCCSKIVPKAGLDLGSGSEARVLLGLAPKNWLTNRRFKHYNLDHSNKSVLFKYLTNDTSLLESIESTGLNFKLEVFYFKFWKFFQIPVPAQLSPDKVQHDGVPEMSKVLSELTGHLLLHLLLNEPCNALEVLFYTLKTLS